MTSLRMLLVLAILLIIAPVHAQDTGAIIEGNTAGADSIGALNPLVCDEYYCERINQLLYPMLLAVDPHTGQFREALPDDNALVEAWEWLDDGRLYLTLRDDLRWSDGRFISANDVLFTLEALASEDFTSPYTTEGILAFDLVDDLHIAVTFTAPGCDALDTMQFPVVPEHVFNQGVANFGYLAGHPANSAPTVTAGDFSFLRRQATDYLRLDGNLPGVSGYEFRDVDNELDAFLNGATNFMVDVPYTWYADIYARVPAGDIQVAEFPGLRWDTLIYNLADPAQPLPAIDPDGDPLEQPPHPVLSDLAVRQAIQLALDVPALIEAANEGHGTPMASSQIPASWAFDPDLAPIQTDIVAARELLENAGWKDTNNDGVRECITCTTFYRGALLSFDFMYTESSRNSELADLISQQLRRVGFSVGGAGTDFDTMLARLQSQEFSMALVSYVEDFPVNPHQPHFTIAADRFDGVNYGSYHNPNVDRLMEQARTVPGCDPDERRRLYTAIQRELQADPPYAWLMVRHDLVAASRAIRGFAPLPGAPLWNVREWEITG